jgi:hypothetical protein
MLLGNQIKSFLRKPQQRLLLFLAVGLTFLTLFPSYPSYGTP